MTITQAFDMIGRGETPEQYEKRINRLRRLATERDDLEASLTVLTDPDEADKRDKKCKRLEKVLSEIDRLK